MAFSSSVIGSVFPASLGPPLAKNSANCDSCSHGLFPFPPPKKPPSRMYVVRSSTRCFGSSPQVGDSELSRRSCCVFCSCSRSVAASSSAFRSLSYVIMRPHPVNVGSKHAWTRSSHRGRVDSQRTSTSSSSELLFSGLDRTLLAFLSLVLLSFVHVHRAVRGTTRLVVVHIATTCVSLHRRGDVTELSRELREIQRGRRVLGSPSTRLASRRDRR